MRFEQALAAMGFGRTVRRPGGMPVRLQNEAVLIMIQGTQSGPPMGAMRPINDNWLICRFPMVQHPDTGRFSIPRSFTDEEMRADDWEAVEEVAI